MQFWYKKSLISYLLLPLSIIYWLIIKCRQFLYTVNFKKTIYFNVPVIVVGNITVGGTGKTPFVIWLANFLKQQGYQPGIVSRGYGGKASDYPVLLNQNSSVETTGDEPLLIMQKTGCPVVIDPIRTRAVSFLLAENPDCNVVISDDGLQHLALGRTLEIVIIDGERRYGNGFYLPAGPLRESTKRLQKVEFIVSNGMANSGEYRMKLVPTYFCQLINYQHQQSKDYFKNKTIHAIAGIGNPQRFFNTLKNLGLNIIEHPFPDHYTFQKTDFSFINTDDVILMTEKDAIKCTKFADQRFWCLPVEAVLTETFKAKLIKKITSH